MERIMAIPEIKGVKHSSLDRQIELQRLNLRNQIRPDFRILTGNDLAIDMIEYGSDYLLGLAAFTPKIFAERDRLWSRIDQHERRRIEGERQLQPNAIQFLAWRGIRSFLGPRKEALLFPGIEGEGGREWSIKIAKSPPRAKRESVEFQKPDALRDSRAPWLREGPPSRSRRVGSIGWREGDSETVKVLIQSPTPPLSPNT